MSYHKREDEVRARKARLAGFDFKGKKEWSILEGSVKAW